MDRTPDPDKLILGVELAMGAVKIAKRCDCDWPPTIPDLPHRPWCASITGVHTDIPGEMTPSTSPLARWIGGGSADAIVRLRHDGRSEDWYRGDGTPITAEQAQAALAARPPRRWWHRWRR